ncbi:MAG: tRNA1(Val) (adenine(37)-N6)-methyltransferase [Dichotomicrobium sp.]
MRADGTSAALSDDAFLGGRLHLLQPRKGARAGTDAVLLAASVAQPPEEPARILEAGCGSGAVALCLAWRLPRVHVTGVEIDSDLCELTRRNAERNGLSQHVAVVHGDVRGPFSALEAEGIRREGYDHVVANPPYLPAGRSRAPANADKQQAHVMAPGELGEWVRFLAACAAPRGRLWLIHRADALPDLLAALKGRFGGVRLFPLFPRAGAPATRIIISGRKGSRAGLKLLPGLVMHDSDGRYTPAAEASLRDGAPLPQETPDDAGDTL